MADGRCETLDELEDNAIKYYIRPMVNVGRCVCMCTLSIEYLNQDSHLTVDLFHHRVGYATNNFGDGDQHW